MSPKNLTVDIKEFISLIEEALKDKNIPPKAIPNSIEEILYGEIENVESNHLNNIIAGNKYCDISWLTALYAAINYKGIPAQGKVEVDEAQKWLIYWLAGVLEWDRKLKENRKRPVKYDEEYWSVWVEAARRLKETIKSKESKKAKIFPSKLPTLNYFPEAFEPLTIITGTGQAIPPDKISDIFRANIRLKDLFFLNEIPFSSKPHIVPDRLVIDMKPSDRIKRFGNTNLLLIGGPKVNAVTRKFCKYGFFRFQFKEKEREFHDLYDDLNTEEVRNELFPEPNNVKLFYRFLENPNSNPDEKCFKELVGKKETRNKIYQKARELRSRLGSSNESYEEIVNIFLPNGLIDPIRNNSRIPLFRFDRDDLLITIAPNLWNSNNRESIEDYKNEYVSVIVAGIDVLGTCTGIKKLSEPEAFEERPLGGFLEANFGNFDLEYDKFSHSSCSWGNTSTPAYNVRDFITKVDEKIALKQGASAGEAFERIKENTSLEDYRKFLKNFAS
jgi:hypothetical protein